MNLELYKHLREGKPGWLKLPPRALWKLTGNDRVRYLNGQITNDVAKLQPGHSLYAAVTSPKGKMMGDVFVSATNDALWIDAPIELRETLDTRLQKYLIADDAELTEINREWWLHHIFAPSSASQLRSDTPPDTLTFWNPRFGLSGFDHWLPLGTGFGAVDVPQIPTDVIETLRLEFALPKWGADMNEDTLPPEAGLERNGISYTKGCYLGQETIARIKSIGHVNKSLMTLAADGAEPPTSGTELLFEGKPVGKVTSSGYSPALEKGIALGYVQRQHAKVGGRLATGAGAVTIIEPPLQLALS